MPPFWLGIWTGHFPVGDMDRPLSSWGYGLASFQLGAPVLDLLLSGVLLSTLNDILSVRSTKKKRENKTMLLCVCVADILMVLCVVCLKSTVYRMPAVLQLVQCKKFGTVWVLEKEDPEEQWNRDWAAAQSE